MLRAGAGEPRTGLAGNQESSGSLPTRAIDSTSTPAVGAFGVRIEQAQIRDKVLLVVGCQCGTGGRGVGDVQDGTTAKKRSSPPPTR